jgi:hypothetical protein
MPHEIFRFHSDDYAVFLGNRAGTDSKRLHEGNPAMRKRDSFDGQSK